MSEATHQVYEREPGQDDGEEDFPSNTSEYAAAALYDPWRPVAAESTSEEPETKTAEDLDEAQAAAVDHWTGPALVTAGPGSGKTRVLTSRVMRLVDRGTNPEEILAITFTRKAATEMKDRLLKHSERFDRSIISAYHSLALSLLREWPLLVERRGRFSVWDDAMSKSEMNKSLKAIWGKRTELKENTPRSKMIHKFLGLWKRLDRPLHGPDFLAACARVHPVCAAIIREYEIDKKNANALDFDDLLWRAVYLLERHPDIRKQVRARWRFVLVDEYQDTNPLQERFIRLVTNEDDNIFVVGDVDQSIFGFQGAQIDHILTFQERWTDTKTYHLGENYRSTRNIVEAATRAIGNNRERIDKHLFTRNDQGWAIETRLCRDAWDEAELAASLVAGSLDAGYSPKEHAILVRLRRQIPSIQTALAKWNIAFQTVGYIELHQRADVKRILAWFQVLMNQSDTAAASLCLSHWPGLGAATVNAWAEHSTQSGRPMFDLFDFMKGQKGFGGKRGDHVLTFAQMWKDFRALTFQRTSIRRLVAWLFEHTGMNAEMETKFNDPDAAEAAEARKNFRDQFVEMCPDTVVDRVDIEITSFLDALLLNAKKPDQQETVTISTIHSAKGREWDHVWILGVNESVLPHQRGGRTDIEEERRLFYVAMTRARTRLVLMHSRYIITYGKEQSPATPSRFLAEIGEAERLDDFWSVDTPELEDEDEVPDFFDFVETPLPESDTPDDRAPWVLDEHQ